MYYFKKIIKISTKKDLTINLTCLFFKPLIYNFKSAADLLLASKLKSQLKPSSVSTNSEKSETNKQLEDYMMSLSILSNSPNSGSVSPSASSSGSSTKSGVSPLNQAENSVKTTNGEKVSKVNDQEETEEEFEDVLSDPFQFDLNVMQPGGSSLLMVGSPAIKSRSRSMTSSTSSAYSTSSSSSSGSSSNSSSFNYPIGDFNSIKADDIKEDNSSKLIDFFFP